MHTHTHSKVHPIIQSQYRRKTGIHLQPHWKRNWLWSLSKSYLLWNTCSRLFQPKSRICLRNFRSEKCNMTWRITSTSFLPFTYSEHMKESVNPQNTTSKMDTVKKQLQLDIFLCPYLLCRCTTKYSRTGRVLILLYYKSPFDAVAAPFSFHFHFFFNKDRKSSQ